MNPNYYLFMGHNREPIMPEGLIEYPTLCRAFLAFDAQEEFRYGAIMQFDEKPRRGSVIQFEIQMKRVR